MSGFRHKYENIWQNLCLFWTSNGNQPLYLCVPLHWSSSLRHWGARAGTFSPPDAACPSRLDSYCTQKQVNPIDFLSCNSWMYRFTHYAHYAELNSATTQQGEMWEGMGWRKGQETVDTPECDPSKHISSIVFRKCVDTHFWNTILRTQRDVQVNYNKGMSSHKGFSCSALKGTS